jgi:hypothetical protein
MCALCGAFGAAEHWTDRPAGSGDATPAAERRRRAAVANRVLGLYGLRLAEWGGRYTLTSRTGKTAVVDGFGALWPAAEKLAGRPCDPLDLDVIAAVERLAAPK